MKNEGCLKTDEFVVKTAEFFNEADKKHINVRLTMKRLVERDPVDGTAEFDTTNQPHFDVSKVTQLSKDKTVSRKKYPLLIRISYGSRSKKTKCSTVVNPDELDQFWQDYSSVIKSNMSGLIKKKKKKGKGDKGKHARK